MTAYLALQFCFIIYVLCFLFTRPIVINVMDFGVVGDGITDDTAAIQAALDEAREIGGNCYLSPGTFRVGALNI